jgi:lipoic acid synthetase
LTVVTFHKHRPDWLKIRLSHGEASAEVRRLLHDLELNTVCHSAHCPNLGECWGAHTATFLILGNVCTRRCTFCAVPKGIPTPIDPAEPERVAEAAERLHLKHVVVTSVTRDDLPDGGASLFADTVTAIRKRLPRASIEVLIPDFQGNISALNLVLSAHPNILNHNLETVPRLYSIVRPQASYSGSLTVIQQASESSVITKSGLMLGLGESLDEIRQVLQDLRSAGCQILTLGQYLQPTSNHLPVSRFLPPEEFASLKQQGLTLGFLHVESGPLVRSSYLAHRALEGHAPSCPK